MTDYGDEWSTTYDTYDTSGSVYDRSGTRYNALDSTYDSSGDNTYSATDYVAVGYGASPTSTTYDTTYDTGYGNTTYDPRSGAYDQHLDYRTPTGRRHHRERVDQSGTYRHRDVDRYDDGSTRVHKEYDNPNTGTSYHRDYEK
ncbi:Endo-1-3(4)-beta-glucanase [Penicillium soppii]|jgi:hypothetical protein|uniref:Endo-1-3(4)-beta-glucanase n=1 Tax=Penicillium soppii TaxID=69789 RepID=UPI00254733C5|nr:Endo-1-3(4)-beta-glucanase [Penicillium soppii]KAJ5861822.1 Endo-1-3(4)-beta-glucanase [Penicillium soppii]